jgi:hypothetical protein
MRVPSVALCLFLSAVSAFAGQQGPPNCMHRPACASQVASVTS